MKLKGLRLFLIAFLDLILPNGKPGDRWRGILMAPLLLFCGKNFCMKRGVLFVQPHNVSIGDNVYIGNYCNIGAGNIIIGNEVILGPLSSIIAQNHAMKNGSYRFGKPLVSSVSIGDGSWTGTNSTILPGVKVGKGCLIGSGVVLRRDVPDFHIVAGSSKIKKFPVCLDEDDCSEIRK